MYYRKTKCRRQTGARASKSTGSLSSLKKQMEAVTKDRKFDDKSAAAGEVVEDRMDRLVESNRSSS